MNSSYTIESPEEVIKNSDAQDPTLRFFKLLSLQRGLKPRYSLKGPQVILMF